MVADCDFVIAPEHGRSANFCVVYWCYSKAGDLLYVGCTGNPVLRMAYHKRLKEWFEDVHWIAMSRWLPKVKALGLECEEIFSRSPKHNVRKRAA